MEQNITNNSALTEANIKLLGNMCFDDDTSYEEYAKILGKGFINLRINNYKVLKDASPQMDIQAALSKDISNDTDVSQLITFNVGDILLINNGYWLCTLSHETTSYKTGKVEECNYELKWQNPVTSDIISRWCSVRKVYAGVLDKNSTIKTGKAGYKIKLPLDKETELFHIGKRFLIGTANNEPVPYSIINFDSVTNSYEARNEGFLVINLKQSVFNPMKDNKYLMIADYKEPKPIEPPLALSCRIIYNGEPIIREGGSPKIFTALFYDSDGEVITALTPAWELIIPSELENLNQIDVLSEVGNRISIRVKSEGKSSDENMSLLRAAGMKFILKASADDPDFGFFACEQEIEIIELF